jgi:sporulation protein YlmC with PRC-barrel domain
MKAFISYEEKGETIEGIFELVEQTNNYIKIKSNKNIIIIPYHKINKIKLKNGN